MQDQKEIEEMKEYLRNNVSGILEKLTFDLLVERPDEVVPYMIDWMKNKGPEVEKEFQRKVKHRPEGVETSESSEDEDEDEVFELPQKKIEQRQKRKSVSAEVYGVYNPKGNYTPKVIAKEETEKQKIKALISDIFMFKCLEEKDLAIIIDAMEAKDFQPGDTVIQEGDDGNELFIVSSGHLKCTKVINGQDKELRDYTEGDVFGELALMYNTPRAASIKALDKSFLYSLDRECFNHIVKEATIQNRNKYEEFLKQVEVLQTLEPYERSKLCDCLEIVNFQDKDVVIKEGLKGDSFFLILEGHAIAEKYNPNTEQKEQVMDYSEKQYFGELALLKEQPRQATIIANGNLKLAKIDRNAFKRILGPLQDILKRNAEKYKKFVSEQKISIQQFCFFFQFFIKMFKVSKLFIFIFLTLNLSCRSSEQSEEDQDDIKDLCLSFKDAMSQFKKLFNIQNTQTLENKIENVHEFHNGVKVSQLDNKYTLLQFKEYDDDLKQKLNAINNFEKKLFDGINLAKVLFCYKLNHTIPVVIVIDGVYNHTMGQVSLTSTLRSTSSSNFNNTILKLFYTNYLMIQQGYANIDLTSSYAIEKNNEIEYVYQPIIGLSKLPADLTKQPVGINISPEGIKNKIKDEKSLVYENLYVWGFYELERQGKDQFIEEIKLYAQQVQDEQTMINLKESFKRAFTEIYEKKNNENKKLCDIDDLFDKVLIYEPTQRLDYEQFLQCFKEVTDNYQQKVYNEEII